MKYFKYLVITLLILSLNTLYAQDQNINLKTKITKNLRCLICQGQSVYDSDSEFANSIKIIVEKKLNDGQEEYEIYDYLKEKFGDWILYDPKFSKNTYFLWLLPLLMFVLGGAIILKLFIKKKKLSIFPL